MQISYRKLKEENWEYRIRFLNPITEKTNVIFRRRFKTKHEASIAALEHREKLMKEFY